MQIIVKVKDKIKIAQKKNIGTNNVNTIECEFELSEEFDGLTPIAIFTKNSKSYKVNIIDNKCLVPQEVLQSEELVELGVYGFRLDGEDLVKRYSPVPTSFVVRKGSYKEGEESIDASPNSFEYYLAECKKIKESMGSGTGTSGKDGKSAYEIAKENGFEGTETEWLASLKGQKGDNGTNGQNGDNGATYTPSVDNSGNLSWTNDKGLTNPNTVNIKGSKGDKGEKGETGTKGDRGEKGDAFTYEDFTAEQLASLKGANGSNGTNGKDGKDGTSATVTVGTVTTGEAGSSASVTNSGTENNVILNFVIPKGAKGDKGDKGENGTGSTGGITSTAITSIQVVDSLPETEETGVLYLVKESTTPAVVNLYPAQNSITNTENGCTITHNNKQATINGTPTSSMWGWTNHFTMPLESGKNYALKLTNASGMFDNSGRITAGSDNVVIKVLLYAYLQDNTEVALVNKELTDTTIYNAQQFLCGDTYKEYYFSIQAKSNVAFSNLVLDVSITEV